MPRSSRQKQGSNKRPPNKRESQIQKAVLVRNFDTKVTEKELYEFFNKMGKVVNVLILRNYKARKANQRAFVYFANLEDAQKIVARKGCPELNLNGQQLYVEIGKSKHVKGLDAVGLSRTAEIDLDAAEGDSAKSLCVNDLPSEVLAHIFNFLDIRDRFRIERVCKRWRDIPWHVSSLLKNNFVKDIIVTDKILDSVLKRCGSCMQCLELDEFHHDLTPQALKSIYQYCPNLTSITFKDIQVTNTKLKSLFTTCTQIKHLCIFNNVFEEKNMKRILPICKNLESLKILHNTVIEGSCFSLLANKLKKLELRNCFKVSSKGFQKLQTCTSLEELTLDACSNLDESVLNFICERFSTTLRKLELNGQFSPDVNYVQIPFNKLAKLEELSIAYTDSLNDSSLRGILRKCPRLWKLDVSRTQVTSVALEMLSTYPKIVDINLSHFLHNANDELVRLAVVGKLESLTLRGCSWLDDGTCLALTEHCKNLRYLDISSCYEISDEMIVGIEAQERLTKLTIIAGGTMISNYVVSPKLVVKDEDLCPYYWKDLYSDDESDDDPDYGWSYDEDSDFCYDDIDYYYYSSDDDTPYGYHFQDPEFFFNEW